LTSPFSPEFKKPLFILNPVAGTSDADEISSAFMKACKRFDWQPQIYQTNEGDDLSPLIEAAVDEGCDVVMVSGGDGTVSEVASALVHYDLPLAIVPMGSGNILARQLKLPLHLEKTFAYLGDAPESVWLNAMHINDRYYVLNASVGFSSALIQNTSREDKRRLGILAYFWTGLRVLIGFQPYRFHLCLDDENCYIRATEIFISDRALLEENILLKLLKVEEKKGQLIVFSIKARTIWDYLFLLSDVLLGKVRRSHRMSIYQAGKRIQITSKNPAVTQADGEVIGKTPMTVEVFPHAVQVLVPNEAHRPKPLISVV